MRADIALFLGFVGIVGGIVVVLVVFVFGGGGGGSICDDPLAPLLTSDISQRGFQAQDVGLTRVIDAAAAGNVEAAEQQFSFADQGAVHNFTHNVDAPLRDVDEELARDLCEAVVEIEEEFVGERRTDRILAEATEIREITRDAAEALGFVRPGE